MKNVWCLLKRLQSFSGKIFYINVLGMILISFLQGMEIFLLIPILSVSGFFTVNAGANSISVIIKLLGGLPQLLGLPFMLGIYVLLVIGQNLLQRSINIRNSKILQSFMFHIRIQTFRGILGAKWDFFLQKKKSDLINLMIAELLRVVGGISLALNLFTALVFTLIQIGFAFWLSAEMTVFVLICGSVLAFFARKHIKSARSLGLLTSELSFSYLSGITDQLNGIKEIKSNNIEESRLHWFQSLSRKMAHEQTAYVYLSSTSQLFYKITSAILIAVFVFLSLKMFHAQQAQLLLIVVIFSRLWPRFTVIQSNVEQIATNISAFRNLIKLEKECEEAQEIKVGDQRSPNKPIHIKEGLECQNVFFSYNQNESEYALQDVSLKIPSKCMTAVVGRSGAGKSTLIDILLGLLQPEKGRILVDGVPLSRDNVLSLRQSISYVPQDPFLFNGSIRENLLLIEPDATEKQIWDALEFSASAEFVRKLPSGLDTIIGDRGIKLSGGERQRLVLARAILRRPSILILDEATSALDTENESKIQQVLERLNGQMTVIVVAHRLSTIRNADQVVVLDQGKVIQQGGFNQLAQEKRGLFRNLLGNQIGVSI